MRGKLCIIICLFFILETQGLPTRKKKRPTSGTNFLKNVLENVIDRVKKGIATPGDNEILNYLSSVKLLKDRICGHNSSSEKNSTPTKKQVTTSRPSTEFSTISTPTKKQGTPTKKQGTTLRPSTERIASPAMPTTSARTRGVTRGTSRKTTLGTTHLTKFETTRKPSLVVPKRAIKASTETPAMIVDVDDDAVDIANNNVGMNDKIEEDRDEIEVTHTVSVSLIKSSEADTEFPTTATSERPENIRTRRSKPSMRPSRLPPSRRSSLSPRPSKRHIYGTTKQSLLVETDLMDNVNYVPKNKILKNKVSREMENEPDEILMPGKTQPHTMKYDNYHSKDQTSDKNRSTRSASGFSSVKRVHGQETNAILGRDEVSYDSGSENLDDYSNQHLESQTTNSNIANKDRETRNEHSYISETTEKLASTKTKETGAIETDSMDTAVNVGNYRNSESSGNLNQDDSTQSKRSASGFRLVERTDEKELSTLLGEDQLHSDSSLEHEDAETIEESETISTRTNSESEEKTTKDKNLNTFENNENIGNLKKDTEGLLMKLHQITKESPLLQKETTKERDLGVYEDLIN